MVSYNNLGAVEKFDDKRLRFWRPLSTRQNDHQLPPGTDPYRTNYGLRDSLLGTLIALLVVGLAIGIAPALTVSINSLRKIKCLTFHTASSRRLTPPRSSAKKSLRKKK